MLQHEAFYALVSFHLVDWFTDAAMVGGAALACKYYGIELSGWWASIFIIVGALICAVIISALELSIWKRILFVALSWLLIIIELLILGFTLLFTQGLNR